MKMGRMEDRIRECSLRLTGKTIYAMGSLGNIEMLQKELEKYGIAIQAILDNDKNKERQSCRFSTCLPETRLLPYDKKVAVLVYSPGYWKAMRKQIKDLGYKNSQIFILNEKDSPNSFLSKCRGIWKGKIIYERITRDLGKDYEILIMRGATGDVYINGLFLQDYIGKNKQRRYVAAGDSKGLEKVLRLFTKVKINIVTLDLEETSNLLQYGIFCGMERLHIKNTFLWQRSLNFNRCRTRLLSEGFNFMDTYRYLIYRTSADYNGRPPIFSPSCDVRHVFEDNALIPGRTILLSPIAYSVAPLPAWFWHDLAEILSKAGYSICANVNEAERKDLDFLKPVFLPLDSCVAFMEMAGGFIGIRSGFCDIVSSANCRKVLLYPSDKPKFDDSLHRCDLSFSSLNIMGLCNDAIEIESEAIDDILVAENYERDSNRNEKLVDLMKQVIAYFVER